MNEIILCKKLYYSGGGGGGGVLVVDTNHTVLIAVDVCSAQVNLKKCQVFL